MGSRTVTVRAIARITAIGLPLVVAGLVVPPAYHPHTVLALLAALATCWFAARAARRAGNRRARVAWTAQSVGAGLWSIAPITWLTDTTVSWLSAADVGRVGFLVCVAVGHWLTSRSPQLRSRVRMMLDGLVGAAAVLIVVWAFVMMPILDDAGRTQPQAGLAYPMGALTLVVFYLFLAFIEMRAGRRRMPMLFAVGLIGISLADIRYVMLSVSAGEPARALDIGGWALGFAFIAAAAASYRGTTPRQTLPVVAWWVAYAPYLALIPAGGTMAWQAATRGTIPALEYAVTAVLVAIILLRQLLMVAENRILVSRLLVSEQRLRHQATHDSLTGLGNRALLVSRLDEMLAERRLQPAPLALMFIDLDDFKNINDSYGHQAGDEVLVQVADRLRRVLRHDDVVVRLGGDEYAAVLPYPAGAAERAAHRLREAFQEPYRVLDMRMELHASIGLTHVDEGTDAGAGELLREADVAMYEAKRDGKNGVRVFRPPAVAAPVRVRAAAGAPSRDIDSS